MREDRSLRGRYVLEGKSRATPDVVARLRRVTDMGDLVDTRAVGPPSHSAPAECSGDVTQMALPEGPYRKVHPDLSCIRLIAASAIVAGLLLGTAPVALAQVGHLIATAPAAFVQELPTQGAAGAGGLDAEHERIQSDDVDRTAYRSELHAVTSMFSWKGTSRAVRCSYGLLVEGNTQGCQAA